MFGLINIPKRGKKRFDPQRERWKSYITLHLPPLPSIFPAFLHPPSPHLVPSISQMATMSMSRPLVSSPLADASQRSSSAAQRILPRRNPSFPSSRALRPFPTISHAFQQPTSSSNASSKNKKAPVKLIEPPKDHKMTFMLDLTQAEFSRQD
ncbi:hypothetical protein BD779DRAFT_1666241 [Infundibulicybe gibba]|nr:hypothetical protein BD779DRAFT_1666241 [Infundibulicybe gibba]